MRIARLILLLAAAVAAASCANKRDASTRWHYVPRWEPPAAAPAPAGTVSGTSSSEEPPSCRDGSCDKP